jgi:hypothetical protein
MLGIVIPVLAMSVPHGVRNDNFYKLAKEFFAPVAEHFLCGGVQKDNGAVVLYFQDAVRSGFEKIPKSPIRLDVNLRFFRCRVRDGFAFFQRSPPLPIYDNSLAAVRTYSPHL